MFVNGLEIIKRIHSGGNIEGILRYESLVDLLVSAPNIWVVEAEFEKDSLSKVIKFYTEEDVMKYLFKYRNELTDKINHSDGEWKVKYQAIEAMFFGDKQKYYSEHKDPRLRQIVANNGCFLDKLAKDKDSRVKAEVMRSGYYSNGIWLSIKKLFNNAKPLCVPRIIMETYVKECEISDYISTCI